MRLGRYDSLPAKRSSAYVLQRVEGHVNRKFVGKPSNKRGYNGYGEQEDGIETHGGGLAEAQITGKRAYGHSALLNAHYPADFVGRDE